jgi:hypothetical protein
VQHFFLVIDREIFEDLGRDVVGQDAQQDRFIIRFEIEKNLGEIDWREVAKNGAKLGEIAFLDQFHQFWLQQISNHALNQPEVRFSSKTKLIRWVTIWRRSQGWGQIPNGQIGKNIGPIITRVIRG